MRQTWLLLGVGTTCAAQLLAGDLQLASGRALVDSTIIGLDSLGRVRIDSKCTRANCGACASGEHTCFGWYVQNDLTFDSLETVLRTLGEESNKWVIARSFIPAPASTPSVPVPSASPDSAALVLVGNGTGFWITQDGYFATALHVCAPPARRWRVPRQDGVLIDAVLVAADATNDVAILKCEERPRSFLPLARTSGESADRVFTFGWPRVWQLGFEVKFTEGAISSLSGEHGDPGQMQITVPVQPGNSGGPLCDEQGNVRGVIVARMGNETGLQNVNYATKVECLNRLAIRLRLVSKLSAPQVLPRDRATRLVKDSVIPILCYQ